MKLTENIEITNECNMELMKRYPDKHFELAIVDPEYGIGVHKMNYTQSTKGGVAKRKDYSDIKNWDEKIPSPEYFKELFRVSKNQIIFGGNYFPLPLTKSWIVWDKKTEDKYSNDFADCELIWTSFDKPAKIVRYLWSGMLQPDMKNKQERFHPTEKPYQVYKWLLDNYAKIKCNHKHSEAERYLCTDCKNRNVKILDTHAGSASIAIACRDYGFSLTACELDPEYYEKAVQRIKNHVSQQKLF
jgi:site-specific DNA-methyltransferase (adenine-specific)